MVKRFPSMNRFAAISLSWSRGFRYLVVMHHGSSNQHEAVSRYIIVMVKRYPLSQCHMKRFSAITLSCHREVVTNMKRFGAISLSYVMVVLAYMKRFSAILLSW